MNAEDIIKTFDRSMYLHFGLTGETQGTSLVRLDTDLTFSRSANCIQVQLGGNTKPLLIEQFANDNFARTAFDRITAAAKRYARQRRLSSQLKAIVMWGFLPVTAFTFAVALNMAVSRPGIQSAELLASSQARGGVPFTTGQASPDPSKPPAVAPAELSKAMNDGVKAGKFSIQLGSGTKGSFFVFSDPSCPSCIELERELDKMSKDYTIHVFPVSVIGGSLSMTRMAKLLCAKAVDRPAQWKKLIALEELSGADCSEGLAAISANDQIFRAMRFDGTPTIIKASGELRPDSVSMTAEGLAAWASGKAQGR